MICVRRVYDPPSPQDGARYLVDRLWPRGLRRDSLEMDGWIKEAAPSTELRRWYHHDPSRWEDFRSRYFAELDENPTAWQPLIEAARQANLTLLYAARDETHNNAQALKAYLDQKI